MVLLVLGFEFGIMVWVVPGVERKGQLELGVRNELIVGIPYEHALNREAGPVLNFHK